MGSGLKTAALSNGMLQPIAGKLRTQKVQKVEVLPRNGGMDRMTSSRGNSVRL